MSDRHEKKGSVFWSARPWILPGVLARAFIFIALGIIVIWLELYFGLAFKSFFVIVPVIFWTGLVLFLAWIGTLGHLLMLKYSHKYVLKNDSLEIRRGILNFDRFIITSSGFSDLEVHQSLLERAFDSGEIEIFSESEKNFEKRMVKVRHPMKVAEQIRFVMGRPIVRTEGTEEGHVRTERTD